MDDERLWWTSRLWKGGLIGAFIGGSVPLIALLGFWIWTLFGSLYESARQEYPGSAGFRLALGGMVAGMILAAATGLPGLIRRR